MSANWIATIAEHEQVIAALRDQAATIDRMATMLRDALLNGRRVYIFGNGGSAADAQHIAAELTGRFKRNRRALPAIALTTDSSALTAIGNDFSFEAIFSRQLEAFAQPGDVAWAISTSGNSPNVLAAARVARERGCRVIGFSGRAGGKMRELCDEIFCVPHEHSDRIQEGHILAYHYFCEQIELAL
ncbi:MAG: SIS domain-containing protein [Phycisphaerae bacterium]